VNILPPLREVRQRRPFSAKHVSPCACGTTGEILLRTASESSAHVSGMGVLQNTPTKKDEVRNRKRVSKPRLFA